MPSFRPLAEHGVATLAVFKEKAYPLNPVGTAHLRDRHAQTTRQERQEDASSAFAGCFKAVVVVVLVLMAMQERCRGLSAVARGYTRRAFQRAPALKLSRMCGCVGL